MIHILKKINDFYNKEAYITIKLCKKIVYPIYQILLFSNIIVPKLKTQVECVGNRIEYLLVNLYCISYRKNQFIIVPDFSAAFFVHFILHLNYPKLHVCVEF